MEGVIDAPMREFLTERGGINLCVTEFIRVSQDVPSARVFYRHVPELRSSGLTASGVPVQVQLLGGNPERLALAASQAVELGAVAIDLNFGCPAPTVNRHDGGAALLRFPLRIREIVEAVRKAVPSAVPVSAKLRLGWDSKTAIHENSERAAEAGASWITIHGRTKVDGYRPPADWAPIAEVRKRLKIPIVANGDIWSVEDFRRCRDATGCEHFMLGRGALADIDLPFKIANSDRFGQFGQSWFEKVRRFAEIALRYEKRSDYSVRRIKQWLGMAHLRAPVERIVEIRRARTVSQILEVLERQD